MTVSHTKESIESRETLYANYKRKRKAIMDFIREGKTLTKEVTNLSDIRSATSFHPLFTHRQISVK